ncbi:N-acyl homoserine lactonase family protein [Halobacterium salinarum]|nr:N-acyl homoserine lactonase family protein [Halobacterium salinarum]MDL0126847.1 N-acyl homoserine lactonase family protein [Halobacterium salinarum]MDL0134196.1 N-acyl homoserine lactonase family protein [Halobacterium salinarum]MDL0140147.1 N-acyl homoserine lactonase family protein [Halobacterium salinarum]WJK63142.1 N-acyl homoserine lactonase family protein [Halobacterium salinarum]
MVVASPPPRINLCQRLTTTGRFPRPNFGTATSPPGVDVHYLDRGTITADRAYMIDSSTMATVADPDPEHALVECPVYNLLIDHPKGTVLWDTGSHPDAGDGYWPTPLFEAFHHEDADEHTLPAALADAGTAISDIDAVVASHLHLDHAGGLRHFAGTDTPIYVHERELGYAYRSAATDTGSIAYHSPDFDRALNWRVVAVDRGRRQLYPGLDLLHLPGHTPGLLGLYLEPEDGAAPAIVAGDEAYQRENYEDGVPMATSLLSSLADWRESRRRVRDLARRTTADVFCGHDTRDAARLAARF